MTNIYHGIWKLEPTGETFSYPVIHSSGEWMRVVSGGSYAPILHRLGNGATFDGYMWMGEPSAKQYATVPPAPKPDAADMSDAANRAFGKKWTTASALRAYRRMSSTEYDQTLRADPDFAAAIEFALQNGIVVPADTSSHNAEGNRFKTYAELTPSQAALIRQSWALMKSWSLRSSRNGLFRVGGDWTLYGGYLESECVACGKKAKQPWSAWVAGQCKCDCRYADDYSEDGRKIE